MGKKKKKNILICRNGQRFYTDPNNKDRLGVKLDKDYQV